MASTLPSGTVTFLFSDIEGSTQLWEKYPEAMKTALEKHDSLLRQSVESSGGQVIKSTGDGIHAVFESVSDAIGATIRAQQALQAEPWDEIKPYKVKVRMGVHTGEAQLRAGDYFGGALNRAARLMSVGHGGQILVSNASAQLLLDRLPPDTTLRDLGEHSLKGLVRPEHVFQLVHPALEAEFPPLQTLDSFPNNLPSSADVLCGPRGRTQRKPSSSCRPRACSASSAPAAREKRDSACSSRLTWLAATRTASGSSSWLRWRTAALIPQTIASVLGVREQMGMPLMDVLLDYLRAKRILLILDNCEHLVEACAKLADQLLHACPK